MIRQSDRTRPNGSRTTPPVAHSLSAVRVDFPQESIAEAVEWGRRVTAIEVVGAGVVGTATGRGLMKMGYDVTFIDVAEGARARLRQAGWAAFAPEELTSPAGDVTVITVCSPTVNGRICLNHLRRACVDLAHRLRMKRSYHLLIVRSTLPPGTTNDFVVPNVEAECGLRAGEDFGLAYVPEFLRQATAEQDALRPWIWVVGTDEPVARCLMHELFGGVRSMCPYVEADVGTAEMIKYAHNLYNATKISFTNEIWMACRKLSLDGNRVMAVVAQSAEGMWNQRYGTEGGYPYEGSCLPKDTSAFWSFAAKRGIEMPLLAATIEVNKRMGDLTDREAGNGTFQVGCDARRASVHAG